jgi:hypothetical protein
MADWLSWVVRSIDRSIDQTLQASYLAVKTRPLTVTRRASSPVLLAWALVTRPCSAWKSSGLTYALLCCRGWWLVIYSRGSRPQLNRWTEDRMRLFIRPASISSPLPFVRGMNESTTHRFVKAWLLLVCCPTASSMVPAACGWCVLWGRGRPS